MYIYCRGYMSINLNDLIGGEAASLPATEGSFLSRGLRVATWRYEVPNMKVFCLRKKISSTSFSDFKYE